MITASARFSDSINHGDAAPANRTRDRGPSAAWSLLTLAATALGLFSWRYVTGGGQQAAEVLANPYAHPWLLIHSGAAGLASILGAFNFLPRVRRARPALHRWTGRLYVAACALGGVCGLPLAVGSWAGPVATTGFGLLAVLWLATTGLAQRAILKRRFKDHRAWMIRSWSLTLSAVTFRLFLAVGPAIGFAFPDIYRWGTIGCWMLNLAVAEAYLRRRRAA